MGNKGKRQFDINILVGNHFHRGVKIKNKITFFLRKQNQCLRRHPCANWSLCVWFPEETKFLWLLFENISYYCLKIFLITAVKIFHQHDFNDQSSMKCAKSNRRCWELAAIKIKYNKNVQFWTQLEKNRWIKKSQCAKWQSPISDRKREFFSINLLTVIVLWR